MMNRYGAIGVALCLMAGVASAAEYALTWEECVQLTATNNPSLAAAFANVDAAGSAISIEESALRPQVSASASAMQSGTDDRATTYGTSLDVEQLLYNGGRNQAAIRSAVAGLNSETALLSGSQSDVTYALRNAFIDVLYAKERVMLLELIEARRADNLELVELRYEVGREHKGSVASSQASLFDAEVKGKQAERSISVSRVILARQMGIDSLPTESVIEGSMIEVSPVEKTNLVTLAQNVPAYRASQAAVARAEAQLSVAQSGNAPQISLIGSVGRYGVDDSFNDDRVTAGVKVSYPIWSGGQTQHAVDQATAALRAADAQLAEVLNERVRVLAGVQQGFSDATDNVLVQTKYEEAAEIRAEISRQQYEGGLLSFENWIVIEDDLIAKQEQLLDARKSALVAEAAWWRSIGYEAFTPMNPSIGER